MFLQRSEYIGCYLYDSSFSWDFKNLSLAYGAITQAHVDDFSEFGEFDIVEDDEGTIYFDDSTIVYAWCDGVIPSDGLQVGVEELSFVHSNYKFDRLINILSYQYINRNIWEIYLWKTCALNTSVIFVNNNIKNIE